MTLPYPIMPGYVVRAAFMRSVWGEPGCRLDAPAGFLHRNLAGPPVRVVLATNLPYEQWTMPIDKEPADRPEYLSV